MNKLYSQPFESNCKERLTFTPTNNKQKEKARSQQQKKECCCNNTVLSLGWYKVIHFVEISQR